MSLSPHGPARVTPAQAHRAFGDGTAVLLDVRGVDELEAGHAPGALPVPSARLTGGAEVPGSGSGSTVVLLCRSGRRSQHTARLPAERGAEAVDVTGGMGAWAAEVLPVQDVHGAADTVI
ncbi:rhodanese-like domain-containing protein [Streptomyces sp. Wb2n-11]|uniref:rhodanese-like domain-containing protein n=1 Tax=Streptomyces sp. Wb2n-11 TaxID=1030533 RepID=UPI000AE17662|nr:rhodanese-like domain-containing protein [Streptomyces sp. Wb2n-11]